MTTDPIHHCICGFCGKLGTILRSKLPRAPDQRAYLAMLRYFGHDTTNMPGNG